MYTSLVFASLAASAAASANLMALPQVKRGLSPRQTESLPLPTNAECATAAISLLGSLPTPPPAIVSDVATNPQTDPCSFNTPSALTSEYSSYSSELLSWVSANEGDLSSVLSQCPELSSYASQVPICSTAYPALANATATTPGGSSATESSGSDSTGAAGSDASGGSGSDATGSDGSSATPTGESGASRQTGAALFALAAAGLVAIAL
ncbi:hypothetical protein HJFPF1_09453 [Paramyrothecium foliicola]|nr:hypothetical protein HJFPF1_09453 [Paramyrothecium foliicola]